MSFDNLDILVDYSLYLMQVVKGNKDCKYIRLLLKRLIMRRYLKMPKGPLQNIY